MFLHLLPSSEPELHFSLVRSHIAKLRRGVPEFEFSPIQIFVERNLGFEAEHFNRALNQEKLVSFYRDAQANRTGILTTEAVKLGAMTATNCYLREQRVGLSPHLVSNDAPDARRRLREQLEIYSLQFKTPENAFQKKRESGRLQGRHCHLSPAGHILDRDSAGYRRDTVAITRSTRLCSSPWQRMSVLLHWYTASPCDVAA